jgi:hypothetical protein
MPVGNRGLARPGTIRERKVTVSVNLARVKASRADDSDQDQMLIRAARGIAKSLVREQAPCGYLAMRRRGPSAS